MLKVFPGGGTRSRIVLPAPGESFCDFTNDAITDAATALP